jgi:hypothetical protein
LLLLTTEVPIDVDILDNQNGVVVRLEATLQDLQGERGVLNIAPQPSLSCLHWGTRIRFWIPNGSTGYQVIGAVVEQTSHGETPEPSETSATATGRRVIVRLIECHALPQQRRSPRRAARFTVQYQPVTEQGVVTENAVTEDAVTEKVVTANAATANVVTANALWHKGTCTEIGAGGMRLRAERHDSWPKRLHLRFNFPTAEKDKPGEATTASRLLCLKGRVLRVSEARSRVGWVEVVIGFDGLSVEEGMRLNSFLCA